MKFWFSGELQRDIAKAYGAVSTEIEARLNEELGAKSYSPDLEKLAFLPVIMQTEMPEFGEVKKYHKKDKSAEFRLKIDYQTFKNADAAEKKSLFKKSLLRAVFLTGDLKIKALDSKQFLSDVEKVLQLI